MNHFTRFLSGLALQECHISYFLGTFSSPGCKQTNGWIINYPRFTVEIPHIPHKMWHDLWYTNNSQGQCLHDMKQNKGGDHLSTSKNHRLLYYHTSTEWSSSTSTIHKLSNSYSSPVLSGPILLSTVKVPRPPHTSHTASNLCSCSRPPWVGDVYHR
jgi:hypothetical protein